MSMAWKKKGVEEAVAKQVDELVTEDNSVESEKERDLEAAYGQEETEMKDGNWFNIKRAYVGKGAGRDRDKSDKDESKGNEDGEETETECGEGGREGDDDTENGALGAGYGHIGSEDETGEDYEFYNMSMRKDRYTEEIGKEENNRKEIGNDNEKNGKNEGTATEPGRDEEENIKYDDGIEEHVATTSREVVYPKSKNVRTGAAQKRKATGNSGGPETITRAPQKPRKSAQKGKCSKLIEYCSKNYEKLVKFLKSHTLNDSRQPYVSSRYTPQHLKNEHPHLYERTVKRIAVDEDEMDMLTSYLFECFPKWLVSTSNVYGHVQRLEDLVDYIICNQEQV